MNRNVLALALAFALPVVASGVTLASSAAADEPARHAQVAPTTFDATFQRYLVGPRGRTAGILLADGGVVWMPAPAFRADAPALKAGDALRIEGRVHLVPTGRVITRALVQQGSSVVADARAFEHHGRRGEARNDEPRKPHGARTPLGAVTSEGSIVALLATPRGKVDGLVLDDGTTAFAWKGGEQLAALGLKVGDKVSLQGRGGTYEKGKGMHLVSIKLPSGETRVLEQAKPQGTAS